MFGTLTSFGQILGARPFSGQIGRLWSDSGVLAQFWGPVWKILALDLLSPVDLHGPGPSKISCLFPLSQHSF